MMLADHPDVVWPLEYRTVGADEAYLSQAHGRDTVTISAHQGFRSPYKAFFADVEDLFGSFAGRPHWGKVHTRRAADLAPLYEQWDAFHSVRKRVDPEGVFMTEYLRELFV